MAELSPFLLAVTILFVFLAIIIVIIILLAKQATPITTSSTPATPNCSTPPNMPTGVVVTNPQGDILAVTWNLLASTNSYTVYIGTTPGYPISSALNSTTVTTNSASFGNLAVGETYYIKLNATNGCGTSPLSGEVPFTLQFNYPARFTINSQSNPAIECCWNDNNIGPTRYQEIGSAFCDATSGYVRFNAVDNSIRLSSDSTRCLTRIPGSPNQVWMNPCVPDSTQTWTFNALDSTLCSPTDVTKCLLLSNIAGFGNASDVTYGPKSTPTFDAFDLFSV